MDQSLYFNRLTDWHSNCVWLHSYRKNESDEFITFYGAPSLENIAKAVYGGHAHKKIIKLTVERLIPCVVDHKPIPKDILENVYQKASNPEALESWEWEKTLSIACALINKKEGLSVSLDIETNDRDYLFGRLLAVADVLEKNALDKDEKRATNAIRYMNAYSKHPMRTWHIIQERLQPYQMKLGSGNFYYSKMIDEIGFKFNPEDFNDKALSGKYLLGFYSQRYELYRKKNEPEIQDEKGENNDSIE